jgi:hypothetical protein
MGFSGRKRLVQRRDVVRIEDVAHELDRVRIRVILVQQKPYFLGPVVKVPAIRRETSHAIWRIACNHNCAMSAVLGEAPRSDLLLAPLPLSDRPRQCELVPRNSEPASFDK